jgi:hypothetical protein
MNAGPNSFLDPEAPTNLQVSTPPGDLRPEVPAGAGA